MLFVAHTSQMQPAVSQLSTEHASCACVRFIVELAHISSGVTAHGSMSGATVHGFSVWVHARPARLGRKLGRMGTSVEGGAPCEWCASP